MHVRKPTIRHIKTTKGKWVSDEWKCEAFEEYTPITTTTITLIARLNDFLFQSVCV